MLFVYLIIMIFVQKYKTRHCYDCPYNIKIQNILNDKYIVNVSSNDAKKYCNIFYASQVFVGKSPLNDITQSSDGNGETFDGNSVLIKIETNKYVFIGNSIFSFNTNSQIISYFSPIGNNDVPYPYAILENGDIYLMIEHVILKNNLNLINYMSNQFNDPYSYYYDKFKIVSNCINSNVNYFKDIRLFKVGIHSYNMSFNSNPEQTFDRLKIWDNYDYDDNSEYEFEKSMEIYVGDALDKIILTKELYVEIIESFGNEMGFLKFNKTILS